MMVQMIWTMLFVKSFICGFLDDEGKMNLSVKKTLKEILSISCLNLPACG